MSTITRLGMWHARSRRGDLAAGTLVRSPLLVFCVARGGLPPSFVAGRAKLQPPRPVGIVRPCWQAPILLPKRSCTPSQFCPFPAISSVSPSCAACASPCLLLSAPAGAVAFWTPSATIVQPAPGQVCSGGAGVRWSVRPHAFAEKLEPESPPTHALRT